jgi:hypothetical protein
MAQAIKIIKASGNEELFQQEKLSQSLRRAGAPKDVSQEITEKVKQEIRNGMTTKEVFTCAIAHLKKTHPALAARYSLKKGMMDLGPAGFLFEQYIAAVLREYGYDTKTNQIMKGECVSHEIDIVAQTPSTHYLLEAKYHNRGGIKTDITVVMYMFARLLDIESSRKRREGDTNTRHTAWLLTNTRFTSKAVRYAQCKGIKLTGWKHPKKESLESLIEAKALYPVTVLPSVNDYARRQFAKHGLYFAKDLIQCTLKEFEQRFGIYGKIANRIQKEVRELCQVP